MTRPLVRVVATPPSAAGPDFEAAGPNVAITQDGTRIVYPVIQNGERQLVVRAMDELEATPLAGLGNRPRTPFISPDGSWVGYFDSDSSLRKVSILGGPPVTICILPPGPPRGASWGPDDTIVFATAAAGGLLRVPAGGGELEELTTPDPRGDHLWPEILPGGKAVLFTIVGGPVENAQIAVLSLKSGEVKVLVTGGSNPRYVPTGHIVFGVGGTLRAVGFDVERLEVTSDPIPVLDGVVTETLGAAEFGISGNGSLVYIAGAPQTGNRTLVWVDRDGREEALAAEPRAYIYPRISPDGSQVALSVYEQELDVWIWDFARETLSRLTFDPSEDNYPVWSPDGRFVIFESTREGGIPNLFSTAAGGARTVQRLTVSDKTQFPTTVSPDGKRLVFFEYHPQTGRDLGVRLMDGDGTVEPLLTTEFQERNAEISPDGRWMAYESDASGQWEVFVSPFPGVEEGQSQVSTGGGTRPLWARDGSELFYLDSSGRLMSVAVRMDSNVALGTPEVVLEQRYFAHWAGRTYDVSPDGKRFLMIKERESPAELILVQNWFEELKRLVPTDN